MCGANNFLNLILRCHLLKQILSEINFFWSQKKVSCLQQGSKMNGFCLKEGQRLKALAAHPTQTSLQVPSPPPPPPSECLPHKKETFITTYYTGFTNRDR